VNNLKKIAVAAAVLCSSFAAQAQETTDINPSWYIQPSVLAVKPDSDFIVDKTGRGAGLKFGKAVDPNWDIQVGTTYGRSREARQTYQQNTLGLDALYFFSRKTFRPFILGGFGLQRDRLGLNDGTSLAKNSPYLSLGLGFQSVINDQWSFQADIRDVHGFLRDNDLNIGKSNNAYITVGLNYAFSKPPVAPAPAPVAEVAPPPPAPVAPPPPPPPPPARFEKVTLSSTELFTFDSAKLTSSQPKLDEIANALNSAPDVSDITITGYADRLGSAKYNQKLSEQRANAVKTYLVGKGIAPSRLNAVGKGEANPVVECRDKKRADLIKCLEPNRRVEVEQITIERRVP
jgi:OOP family OmpA-OmpF porin